MNIAVSVELRSWSVDEETRSGTEDTVSDSEGEGVDEGGERDSDGASSIKRNEEESVRKMDGRKNERRSVCSERERGLPTTCCNSRIALSKVFT